MSDEGKKATVIGAAMFGVPGVQEAVRWEVAKDRLRLMVRALGGSGEEAEAIVASAVDRWQATIRWDYTIEDACSDELYAYTLRETDQP